jgi:hypothetical protein
VAIIAAGLAVLLRLRSARWALVTALVGVACLWYVLSRPTSREAGPFRAVCEAWFAEPTSSPEHTARLAFMVITGLGLVAIMPFLRPRVLAHRATAWVCLLARQRRGLGVRRRRHRPDPDAVRRAAGLRRRRGRLTRATSAPVLVAAGARHRNDLAPSNASAVLSPVLAAVVAAWLPWRGAATDTETRTDARVRPRPSSPSRSAGLGVGYERF